MKLFTQDNLDLAHRLMEIGDKMDNLKSWGRKYWNFLQLEEERTQILEELGMALAVFLLEEEAE